MPRVFRILLTGGPSAGKTTIKNCLEKFLVFHFPEKNVHSVFLQESATMILQSTKCYACVKNMQKVFQNSILSMQKTQEESAENIVSEMVKHMADESYIFMFFDRGVMDGHAFTETTAW